jgi:hypothetical protein
MSLIFGSKNGLLVKWLIFIRNSLSKNNLRFHFHIQKCLKLRLRKSVKFNGTPEQAWVWKLGINIQKILNSPFKIVQQVRQIDIFLILIRWLVTRPRPADSDLFQRLQSCDTVPLGFQTFNVVPWYFRRRTSNV